MPSKEASAKPKQPLSFSASDQMTIELWLKLNQFRSVYHILGKRASCSQALINYQIARDGSLLQFASGGVVISTGVDPAVGQWIHMAVTYDGATLKLYIDGNVVTTRSYTMRGANTAPLDLGDSGTCPTSQRFIGDLDDVRIWNTTRTQGEIQANRYRRLQGNEPGLVGYWKLDEGSGQVVGDATSNNQDGTLGSTAAVGGNDPSWVLSTAPENATTVYVATGHTGFFEKCRFFPKITGGKKLAPLKIAEFRRF